MKSNPGDERWVVPLEDLWCWRRESRRGHEDLTQPTKYMCRCKREGMDCVKCLKSGGYRYLELKKAGDATL